jgi:hypothetical protein
MKLLDLMIQLDSEGFLPKKESYISGASLRALEKRLFECEEFKNVARINFLDVPTYKIDSDTKEPISLEREYDGEVELKTTATFKLKQNDEIKLNRYVDIYSLQLIKVYNTSAVNLDKPGVWIFPTTYNLETFIPKNEIRIIWNPEQLQDALMMMGNSETSKSRLMRMFEDALDNMETNIPCEYGLFFRGSERSVVSTNPEPVPVVGGPPDSNGDVPGDANHTID